MQREQLEEVKGREKEVQEKPSKTSKRKLLSGVAIDDQDPNTYLEIGSS